MKVRNGQGWTERGIHANTLSYSMQVHFCSTYLKRAWMLIEPDVKKSEPIRPSVSAVTLNERRELLTR